MSKFILEIDLGNEAMLTPIQIRNALAKTVQQFPYDEPTASTVHGKIRDINGNVVGKYEVV